MNDGARARLESPVGPITLIERNGAIVELEWDNSGDIVQTGVLGDAVTQLQEYFAGSRQVFDLPLEPRGSAFQQKFYAALSAIPYGETRTYGDLAAELGVSAQAIGQACGANPIAILIPCHRVLGATGLGGFSGAGGVEAKIELLKLEGAASLLI
ncbi:methylated-DNA-[protein]-cysteine S-methyltransferase [Litoreibacter ascidiaceicola]|uniref:Methylated-DNA--protein-cysteine methyltransferase n=1 Tax=Litoreibacter ascidiaceicola TaxID=1486859 RepID=A0A1M4XYE9_9RHOB|nr:methylated-DNA--[protein]-cysteine S-methyltransferase [Litoreibacter ascidiaceicola]SHE98458.1 methylated-DNA-[protein]-cysteine S-methyltransferase [Litoreibacter ascidiaceicola]